MFKIDFIQKMEIKFGKDKFDYSLLPNKFSSKDKIKLICKKHGTFEQRTDMWLFKGCSLCNIEGLKLTTEEWIKKAQEKHKNIDGTPIYTYLKAIYTYSDSNIIITCPIHGDFEQIARNHLMGAGCPNCSGNKKLSEDRIKEKAREKHKKIDGTPIYTYKNISLKDGNKGKMTITCPIHGDFEQRIDMHLFGQGCPNCYSDIQVSKQEEEVSDFIKSLNIEIKTSVRNILQNNQELDIYIPSKNIAIEYNGLYWHNELNKDDKYHLQKTEECLKLGIRLIHIFEDEWVNKQDIVKSRLINIFGITKNIGYARNCFIKELKLSETKKFLDENHIQGNCMSTVQLGLFRKNENNVDILLGVMTFGSLRKSLGSKPKYGCYELLRFCNRKNITIVGGASKLLKYFIKTRNPKNIISYCDRRWSDGNLYEKLGFHFLHNTVINYFYVFGQTRVSRSKYIKSNLVKYHDCPKEKTEKDFCFSQGWYRIYDCGNKKYELNLEKK